MGGKIFTGYPTAQMWESAHVEGRGRRTTDTQPTLVRHGRKKWDNKFHSFLKSVGVSKRMCERSRAGERTSECVSAVERAIQWEQCEQTCDQMSERASDCIGSNCLSLDHRARPTNSPHIGPTIQASRSIHRPMAPWAGYHEIKASDDK